MVLENVLTGILTVLIGILLVLYNYFTWNFNYWRKRGVAGPRPWPYLGSYPKSSTFQKDTNFLLEADEIYIKYWRKHRFVGTFEFAEPVLLILDPILARDVYVKYFKNFNYNTLGDAIVPERDPMFGSNPFNQRDELWKKSRTEISPALTMQKMKPLFSIVKKICEDMVKYVDEKLEAGTNTFVSKELASRFTAGTICNCGYGLDSNSFGEHSEFFDEAMKALNHSSKIHNILLNVFPFIGKIFPAQWMSKASNDWFTNLMGHAIELRRQSDVQRDDFLNSMLELKAKKNVSSLELAVHGYTFFLDGFETSSHFLACVLNELARNPEAQQKLRDEILSYETIGFDELNQMPYLDLVFNEGLRVCPFPFPLWKRCTESVEFTDYDGTVVKIEKGIKISVPTYSIHHHPEFYSEPHSFKPERFDESTGHGLKYYKDAGVFLPFGSGPRLCLGMRFAILQIKAALCELIRNFEARPKKPKCDIPSGWFFFTDTTTEIVFRRL